MYLPFVWSCIAATISASSALERVEFLRRAAAFRLAEVDAFDVLEQDVAERVVERADPPEKTSGTGTPPFLSIVSW